MIPFIGFLMVDFVIWSFCWFP